MMDVKTKEVLIKLIDIMRCSSTREADDTALLEHGHQTFDECDIKALEDLMTEIQEI